jgi:1,4-dihydroxy-2-naphthoate octaprenyltransferase
VRNDRPNLTVLGERKGGQLRILAWMKASRAPFFLDVMFCVCLGAAVAWHESGAFDVWLLAACLAGVMLLNGGTNLANDYYDHLSGADEANPGPTPFSGGSRAIQEGTFSPRAMRNAAFICFALAAAVGAFLFWRLSAHGFHRVWPVLAIGAVGALSGFFYTAPPLRLGYRGWGEFLAGLNVGPLAILGSYCAQAGVPSWGVVLVSLPLGFLSSALLVINEIPDADVDRAVGKRHLVARMGVSRAPWAYLLLVVAAYASAGAAVLTGLAPPTVSLVFLTAPVGLWAFAASRRWVRSAARSGQRSFPDDAARPTGRIVPALAANVVCLLLSGALLCTGYLVAGGTAG